MSPARLHDRQTHVLLLCEDDDFAYRVLRATAAAGARVSILARGRGSRLRFSRCAGRLQRTDETFEAPSPPAVVALIERLVSEWEIDIVAPTNATTTRFLCAVRGHLKARVVPVPSPRLFDQLNDKWRFAALATELGLPHPPTRLFNDREELRAALKTGLGERAGVVKPLSASGGRGVRRLGPGGSAEIVDEIGYAPILWQGFAPGHLVSASAFCLDGQIQAFLAYSRQRGVYHFEDKAAIRREAGEIIGHTRYSGLVNFDLVATPDGGHVWLECNPRAFFTIEDQAAAGANFMAPALALNAGEREAAIAAFNRAAADLAGKRMRKLRASAWALARGRRLTELDRRFAAHELADPALFGWDRLREVVLRLRTRLAHGPRPLEDGAFAQGW